FDSAKQSIENEVREDHSNVTQTPVMKSKWKGNDLLLAVKPADPQKVPETVLSNLEPDSTQEGSKTVSRSNLSAYLPGSGGGNGAKDNMAFILNKDYLWNLDHPGKPFDEAHGAQLMQSARELIGGNFNDPQYQYNACQIQIQMDDIGGARDK